MYLYSINTFRAKQGDVQLLKLLFGLSMNEAVEEQRQKEADLVKTLATLQKIFAEQKNFFQLRSCCSSECPCQKKKKKRIEWKHHCGGAVYLTNFGKMMCKKCNLEKEAEFWKLYCMNGTADDYNYTVNSMNNVLFVCAESLKEMQNMDMAKQFLQEFSSGVQKSMEKK